MPHTSCALILAAGHSQRFGSDKRQHRLPDGQTLLQASLALPCAHLDEIWLALRADESIPDWLPADVRVLQSPASRLGLSHSIAASVARIAQASKAETLAVFLADMPFIRPATLHALLAAASPERICRPACQGRPGHPVLFGRAFWPALAQLQGDNGARAVLQTHPEAVLTLELGDPGVLQDIDRPSDLPAAQYGLD
ncbi:nucleotidyltransferase family protein [Pseudomonas entomophila]|uniref:nucleotidyltransferase family protein n=1 Tax=Pseudomonas entomophila TaxID=312306 RepID=UPI0023D8020C|nr:nucleotidyltransferase family protein [Pseudomonas entomophila]MDF0731804.1 nucleotidyltransferase family protein [Pseudomonas entomophila]